VAAVTEHQLAHSEVIDYVLSLNAMAGEPVAKAHEIYHRHRARALPLLKAQAKNLQDEATDGIDRSAAFLALDGEIAKVYRDCLEQLKVLWLTEFSGAEP
jgi:hypothetical protein